MVRNQIKIVSDGNLSTLAFYIKNEEGKWHIVSNSSELSRRKFGASSIRDCAIEIVGIISSTSKYNRANRGVDIIFEGANEDFVLLQETIDSVYPNCNVSCSMQQTRVAVAGKVGAGKTTAIESIINYKNLNVHRADKNGVTEYVDDKAGIVFYEIPGIQLGGDSEYNIEKAEIAFHNIAYSGLSALIYCLGTNKIEQSEEDFINKIREQYADISILLILAKAFEADAELTADNISKTTGFKVIPILAEDMPTREHDSVIQAYGIDNVNHFIFEGK